MFKTDLSYNTLGYNYTIFTGGIGFYTDLSVLQWKQLWR